MRCPSCKNPLTIAPLRANFYQCYNSGCPLNYVAVGEALSDEEEVVKKVTYDSVITLLYDLKIPALLHLNDKQKEVIFKWVEQWQ